ncbi:hypothetical protein ATCC90586_011432 [Pythium insidiosum]|nr:hypothetical protein ATCC90586_011432 [Pythium insidiosum]
MPDEQDASSFYHEGTDHLLLHKLRDQLAVLPDLVIDDKPADVSAADVGEADESTPEEVEQVRSILRKHQSVFLGSGNAVPPPARGVVCDIEVPAGTKPISQRARRIPGHLLEKVYELVKRLLEAGIVEYSDSEQVNQLITLMSYPLPLIDEMLDNFDKAMWFLSLDMASGFWAISMTPPRSMGPVLGRGSYIDDIASKSETWDDMCKTLDNLLYRLRYWRISVNLNKSAFGKRSIDYLSHEINREGIRATPKSAKSLSELVFCDDVAEGVALG